MNCPICNEPLKVVESTSLDGHPRYNYVCIKDSHPHFTTDCYASLEGAKQEVESGNSYSKTSTTAYWKRRPNEEVYCSHCASVIGRCHTDLMYNELVAKNLFCRSCGRSMKPEVSPVVKPEVIPRTITVQDYNKIYHKNHAHAESFIKLLDSSAAKSGAYDSVMHQFECIGWPQVQPTILAALEMYKQIMKSKCAGRTCKSEYRHVTLCENCQHCVTITDDGAICKLRGAMPVDGYCSSGIPIPKEHQLANE